MTEPKPTKPELTVMAALAQSSLSDLVQRAETLAKWDHILRQGLPESLAKHCSLVSWDDGKLLFQASSPVWKNKLHLHSREILDHANAAGLHAREVRIRINPAMPDNTNP